MTRLGHILARIVRWSASHRRGVFLAWATASLLVTTGVAIVEIRTTTDSVLVTNDERWAFYQRSKAMFEGDDILVVAAHQETPVSVTDLLWLESITANLEGIKGVRRVDSLSSVAFVQGSPDGDLDLSASVDSRQHPELAERVAASLVHDRIAPGSLISRDSRTLGINIHLDDNGGIDEQIIGDVRGVLGDASVWLSGVPIFRVEATNRTRQELVTMIPVTILLMIVVMWAMFRNAVSTGLSLLVSGIGVWMMVAAMGFAAVPLTLITAILPPVLLAIGAAYAIHFVRSLEGRNGEEGRLRSMEEVAAPIFVSGVTTAVGFIAMGQVNIQTIRDLGLFGALGVLVTLAATLTLGPALAPWVRPRPSQPQTHALETFAKAASGFVFGRPGARILAFWLALSAVFVGGLYALRVETDVSRWFGPEDPVRVAYDSIARELSGISPVNIIVESRGEGLVTEPGVLAKIDGLTRFVESQEIVGKALSVADPIRQLNSGFLGDRDAALPQSRAANQQLLLLLESVEQIRDLVSPDREAANIIVRLQDSSSARIMELADGVEQWWEQNGIDEFEVTMTGIMHEFARSEDEIVWGQIRGLTLAIVAVFCTFFALFRSLRLSLLAIVPNAIPVLILFGTMGLAGVRLDAGTILAGCVALGIAVDDTVHIVYSFVARRNQGVGTERAAVESVTSIGPSLIATTVTIGLGFLVLGLSGFAFTRNLGLLISSAMFVCLAADLTLLPAMLARWGGEKGGRSLEAWNLVRRKRVLSDPVRDFRS